MQGSEAWKWAVVAVLSVVFAVVARNAYMSASAQEYFPPPTDYLEGDSFDKKFGGRGPGAGMPVSVPAELPEVPIHFDRSPETGSDKVEPPTNLDWDSIDEHN